MRGQQRLHRLRRDSILCQRCRTLMWYWTYEGTGAGASLVKLNAAMSHSPSIFFQTSRYLPMSKTSPSGPVRTCLLIPIGRNSPFTVDAALLDRRPGETPGTTSESDVGVPAAGTRRRRGDIVHRRPCAAIHAPTCGTPIRQPSQGLRCLLARVGCLSCCDACPHQDTAVRSAQARVGPVLVSSRPHRRARIRSVHSCSRAFLGR